MVKQIYIQCHYSTYDIESMSGLDLKPNQINPSLELEYRRYISPGLVYFGGKARSRLAVPPEHERSSC